MDYVADFIGFLFTLVKALAEGFAESITTYAPVALIVYPTVIWILHDSGVCRFWDAKEENFRTTYSAREMTWAFVGFAIAIFLTTLIGIILGWIMSVLAAIIKFIGFGTEPFKDHPVEFMISFVVLLAMAGSYLAVRTRLQKKDVSGLGIIGLGFCVLLATYVSTSLWGGIQKWNQPIATTQKPPPAITKIDETAATPAAVPTSPAPTVPEPPAPVAGKTLDAQAPQQ
ncbi:MAG: hypothetical protein EXR11_10670 [Rhodospirillaceae bacterium]|nr:hypothetical protein [Rhodospirillaceae bacterium]